MKIVFHLNVTWFFLWFIFASGIYRRNISMNWWEGVEKFEGIKFGTFDASIAWTSWLAFEQMDQLSYIELHSFFFCILLLSCLTNDIHCPISSRILSVKINCSKCIDLLLQETFHPFFPLELPRPECHNEAALQWTTNFFKKKKKKLSIRFVITSHSNSQNKSNNKSTSSKPMCPIFPFKSLSQICSTQ